MDKALNYLSLGRKAGRLELGEEPVGAAARAKKARLILVASDAGDHSWRRAKSFVAGTEQLCLKIPYTKDQLGQAIGRTSLAMAAFTDPAMALAFVKALGGGLTIPLNSFSVFLQEQGAVLEQTLSPLPYRLHEYRAEESRVCLCTTEDRPDITILD